MAPAARNPMVLAGALLLSLAAQGALAEFPAFPFSSIPQCVTDCVEKAGCNILDLQCMCDQSSGGFLPEAAACIRAGCDASMSVDTLIEPLVKTCGTMDAPVPSAAVSSAHEAATGAGDATQTPGEPSAVPKPPPRTTDTTMTTSTNAGTATPATTPGTTVATTTEAEATPTGTAAPTSPDESSPSSAPPESAAPVDRASLLGASVGLLLMLAVRW